MGVREAGGDVVTLNFMDFVHKLEGISNLDASTDSMGGGMHTPRKSSSAVTEEILDGLRRKIQVGHESALSSTGSRKVSIPNVENAFRDCCRENSRDKQFMASKTQFANAMDAVNIHIRAADIEGLFDALNGDRRTTGDDEVDYRNFIDLLTSSGGRIAPSSPRSLSPRLSRSSSKMDRK